MLLLVIHLSLYVTLPPLGYYNGIPSDIDDTSIHTGGQCEDGLRLILAIGDVPIGHVTDPVSPISRTGSERP